MEKKAGRGITPILKAGRWIKRPGSTKEGHPVRLGLPGGAWRNFLTGFTFIELVVVVFILSLMLLIALPNFKNVFPGTYLSSSARRIAGEISWLHHEAGFSGRRYRLNIDLDEHGYWAVREVLGDEMKMSAVDMPAMKKLLPGVSFRDVVTGTEKVEEGEAHIDFSPYGLIEPAVIHLVNSEGEELSVMINCFTGKAEILCGYIEQKDLSVEN